LTNPRIIAGSARGTRLQSVPGDVTRPITDRVKEALFNILGADIVNATFFDLFSGTGSVGIEALSRGARFARLNDLNRAAIVTIKANLEKTHLAERAEVLQADVFALLKRQPDQAFDYIYIAPPQYKDLWVRALHELDANPGWIKDDTWVIVQIDPVEYSPQALTHLAEFEQRKYGSTLLVFYESGLKSNQ
jgi:16S rRNA (guanine(966)-N(2))-methyltransferase RsmD